MHKAFWHGVYILQRSLNYSSFPFNVMIIDKLLVRSLCFKINLKSKFGIWNKEFLYKFQKNLSQQSQLLQAKSGNFLALPCNTSMCVVDMCSTYICITLHDNRCMYHAWRYIEGLKDNRKLFFKPRVSICTVTAGDIQCWKSAAYCGCVLS